MHKVFLEALGTAALTTSARTQSTGHSLLVEKPDGRIVLALANSQPFAEQSGRAA